jgi:hypothetical protein
MSIEKAKVSESVAAGLIAGTQSGEGAKATGKYTVECFDKDGNLKWSAETPNLVVNVGLQYMAGAALTSTAAITTWYLGLYGAGASNTPAASDTMSSHIGWTEITPYSNANRPTATFAAATNANPSVVTNSASVAQFNINATNTVGGAFLTSDNTKGGTTGTLFSAADFQSPGDRTVTNGDTLNVTYTMSLAG